MCGHESAGPLKGMFNPSSIGTLTRVKMIEACVESILPMYPSNLQYRVISFILVRTIRSYVYIVKLCNPSIKMTILKIVILAMFQNRFYVSKPIDESDFRQSAKALHEHCL
jgi:hypothetical protein